MANIGMAGPTGKTGNQIPKGYKAGQMQQFTPEMMELFSQLIGQIGPDSFLSKLAGGDQSMFEEMEQPALRQFGELQGGLASKFSGMGMGGRRSSGFSNTMNQAASDFASGLQSKRTDMRMNAIKELQGMGNQLLQQKPYENFLTKKAPTFLEALMGALGENLGSVPSAVVRSQGMGV
jgi:hypothetical protein